MQKIVFTFVLSLAFSLLAIAQTDQNVSTLIQEGDQFSTLTYENQKALDKLLQAEKLEPANYEILWRISRSYVDIGEHLPNKTDAEKNIQLAFYQKSLDYAERSIKANPNGSTGYLRRAIANGRVALFKGIWSAIDFVKQVKVDCEKTISLDDKNASAYYVYARTHAKLCEKPKMIRWPLGLSWANYDDAVSLFEKAIALSPNFIMYKLDAARTYIEIDNYSKAKEYLTAIASLPKLDEDDDVYRKEAKELLEKLQ